MDELEQFIFFNFWPCNFQVWRVEFKTPVVVDNEAWDWANPEYLSISFLAAFRDLRLNDLTELPAGIFDSLASLTFLYVFLLAVETSFVLYPLQPNSFFSVLPWPNQMQLDRASALWMNFAFILFEHANFQVRGVETKVLVMAGSEAWGHTNPEYLIDFFFCCCCCCFQKSLWQWPDRTTARHLRLPGFTDTIVRTFADSRDVFCFLSSQAW